MSRKDNCWDNVVAGSFFATLEWELLADSDFATCAMASRALMPFIRRIRDTSTLIRIAVSPVDESGIRSRRQRGYR